jgi:hypothetical protein
MFNTGLRKPDLAVDIVDGTDGAAYLIISGHSSHTSSQGDASGKQDSIQPDSAIPVAHPITDTSEPRTHTDSSTSASGTLRSTSPQSSASLSTGTRGKMELKVSYSKFERRIKLPPTVDRNRVRASYGMGVVQWLRWIIGRRNSKEKPHFCSNMLW